jgi:hypothetical protein
MIEVMYAQWLILMINRAEMVTIIHLRIVIEKRNISALQIVVECIMSC